jgi:hypothetical protein
MVAINWRIALVLNCLPFWEASAHTGGYEQVPIAADADWPARHMAGKTPLSLFVMLSTNLLTQRSITFNLLTHKPFSNSMISTTLVLGRPTTSSVSMASSTNPMPK